jgi:hypothetical protein
MKTVSKTLMAAVVLAAGLMLVDQARAADIRLQPWRKQQVLQPAGPPSNPATVMSCPDCRTVSVVVKRDVVAGRPAQGKREVAMPVHPCESCAYTLARKPGTKQVAWVHNCSMPESPACCGA